MKSIASIEKRLRALELYQEEKSPRTIVVFDKDGIITHDGDVYQTLDAAKADNPGYDLWVIIICEDMRAK